MFRVVNRDSEQARLAGDYLAEQWADAKIGILHDGTVYGQDLADATRRQLNRHGVKEAHFGQIMPGQTEYAETVSALEAAGIEVLFYGGYTAEAALIARHAHERGYDLQLVGSDNLNSEYFQRVAGPGAEGVRFVSMADPRRHEAAAPVVAKFRAEGYEPEGFTLYGYAVVQVWAQAVQLAGTFDAGAVADALRRNQFDTVLGRLGFDDKGDVTGIDFLHLVRLVRQRLPPGGRLGWPPLAAVLRQPPIKALLSDEHFSVDGTLIAAWASMKSFKPKDGDEPPARGGGRNGERDFHGEQRTNATHASTTDPDARLLRKGRGKDARLCHMGHLLMENRHGLIVDATLTPATGTAERGAALAMLGRQPGRHRATLGADKAYDSADFVADLRTLNVTPHVAQNTAGRRSARQGQLERRSAVVRAGSCTLRPVE